MFGTRRTVGALGFVLSVAASSQAPSELFQPRWVTEVREFRLPEEQAEPIAQPATRSFAYRELQQDWESPALPDELFENELVADAPDPDFPLKLEDAVTAACEVDEQGEPVGKFYLDRYLPRPGDTLRTVAARLGCLSELLALLNGGRGVDDPLAPSRSVEIYRGTVATHRVQAGETLWAISRQYRTPLRELLWLNRLETLELEEGRVLFVARGVVAPEVERRAATDLHTSVLLSKAKQQMREGEEASARSTIGEHVRRPVRGTVTSGFGWRRHPFLHRMTFHRGLDIRAPRGTLIRAIDAGKVVFAGEAGPGGKSIILRHANRLYSIYAHCSQINVTKGDVVPAGAEIARVGATGRATAPHLHFAMKRGATSIDPLPFVR